MNRRPTQKASKLSRETQDGKGIIYLTKSTLHKSQNRDGFIQTFMLCKNFFKN